MGYPPRVTHKPLASRLDTLDGETVYLVDCRFDDSDIFLKQMQAWFAEHMPGVRTVFKPVSSVYLKDGPGTREVVVGGETNGYWRIMGCSSKGTVSVDDWWCTVDRRRGGGLSGGLPPASYPTCSDGTNPASPAGLSRLPEALPVERPPAVQVLPPDLPKR